MGTGVASNGNTTLESMTLQFQKADEWDKMCRRRQEQERERQIKRRQRQMEFVENVQKGEIKKFLMDQQQKLQQKKSITLHHSDSMDNEIKRRQLANQQKQMSIPQSHQDICQMDKASSNIFDISSAEVSASVIEDHAVPVIQDNRAFLGLKITDFLEHEPQE